jgi:hypothetical protein
VKIREIESRVDPEWLEVRDMQRRHCCYTNTRLARTMASAAKKGDVEDDAGAAEVWPSAKAFSSVRMQPVLSVSSVGQTTRLKFALWNVRQPSLAVYEVDIRWIQ